MATGRQTIGGREYVYEYISVWNREKGRSEQRREYLGRIIDGEFVPNKKWLLKQELQEEKAANKRGLKAVHNCKRTFAELPICSIKSEKKLA